jgi:hypothetical protein
MHDPVPETEGWLKSVVHGYFNYYAAPGNLDSLAVFRGQYDCAGYRKLFRAGSPLVASFAGVALAVSRCPLPLLMMEELFAG